MKKKYFTKIKYNIFTLIAIQLIIIINLKIYPKDFSNTINQENCQLYTVENGDSIIKILRKNSIQPIFGTNGSLNEFYKLNNRINSQRKNLIKKGQIFCLPKIKNKNSKNEEKIVIEKEIFSDNNCTKYQVKKNDTLIKILKKQNLSPIFGKNGSLNNTLIINKKNITQSNYLKINEIICLPNKIKNDEKELEKNNEILKIEHNFSPLISKNPITNNDTSLNENYKKFLEKNITQKETKSQPLNINEKNEIKEKTTSSPIKIPKNNKKTIVSKTPEKKRKTCINYKTKEGETYIEILRKNKLLPIYGKEGSFEKNLDNNKHITKDNYIFKEGEELCLENNSTTNSELPKNQNDTNIQKVYSNIGSHYLRIIDDDPGSQTKAVLLSRLLGRTELGLIQAWNPLLRTHLGIRYEASQIMQSDTAIVIGESIFQLIHLAGGIQYHLTPQIYGKFHFIYGDELIFRAVDFETIMLEKLPTAKLKVFGGYKLFENEYFNIYGELGFSLNKPFENEVYKANFGKGYEFAITANHQNNDWEFYTRLYFSRYWTVIQPINFDYTEVGISFGLATDLPY